MKKKIILCALLFIAFSNKVLATNYIHNIDIDIYIDENGNANITETWDVDGDNGTEWYKVMNNLNNSKLSDFTVMMDDSPLQYKNWNVSENLKQKRGYYGINYTSNGLELCFGKWDYNRHVFTLNYTLSNYIFNTNDSQVLYWNLIDKLSDVSFEDFSVTVSSYYDFPSDMEIYGYGYVGRVDVLDGKITMHNIEKMNDSYVTLLAKFPLNTFNNSSIRSEYNTFDDVLKAAKSKTGFLSGLISTISMFVLFTIGIFISLFLGYGYKDNKKLNRKQLPFYRDIPCNKDIYYARTLLKLNNSQTGNILGAIILKWTRNNKIAFIKKDDTKKKYSIDLRLNPTFDNELERELFNMMLEASVDGILEQRELERWCNRNHSRFTKLFDDIDNAYINKLKSEGHIYKRTNRRECHRKNVMDDTIYAESVKLYGLKNFLEEFAKMDTKEVLDVHLWDEYLMFAYLFGIANKVTKQLKNLYPDAINGQNYDYDTLMFINSMSYSSMASANTSSDGGGGASGGGGGGSR